MRIVSFRGLCLLGQKVEQTILETVHNERPETLEQLIALVEKKLPEDGGTVSEKVNLLLRKGEISAYGGNIVYPRFADFSSYLKKGAYDFWITIVLTVACAIIILAGQNGLSDSPLRYLLGSLLTLVLPGYNLLKILFPSRIQLPSEEMDFVLRIILSVVFSIGIVSFVSLLYDYTSIGVRLDALVLSLSELTVLLAMAGLWRGFRDQSKYW